MQAQVPDIPHFRIAYREVWHQTSKKPLLKSSFGTDNDPPMNFLILGGWVWGLAGGGGGKNFLAYCGRCVWIPTWVPNNFFLVHGPPNQWQGSWVQIPATPGHPHPPSPHGPLPVRTSPFSRWFGCLVTLANHLAEVVRSKPGRPVYMGKRHTHFGPFWAYSRTLPPLVELLV